MSTRAKPDMVEMHNAVQPVLAWLDGADQPVRQVVASAVRTSARYLAAAVPGGAVEVRVPPYVAVQCIEGLTHKRGTPPNVVEMDARTWLELVTGRSTWTEALDRGALNVSGQRADLSAYLPLT